MKKSLKHVYKELMNEQQSAVSVNDFEDIDPDIFGNSGEENAQRADGELESDSENVEYESVKLSGATPDFISKCERISKSNSIDLDLFVDESYFEKAKMTFNDFLNYTYFLITLQDTNISLKDIEEILVKDFIKSAPIHWLTQLNPANDDVVQKKLQVAGILKRSNKLFENDEEQEKITKSRNNIEDFASKVLDNKKTYRNLISPILEAKKIDVFKQHFFNYLYKKLVNPFSKSPVKDSSIAESLSEIVNMFKDLLESKLQSAFSVNLGTLFEEYFLKYLLADPKQYSPNLKHQSKKISIVLIWCCNKIFEDEHEPNSMVFKSLKAGNEPTENDYIADFNAIRIESGTDYLKKRVNDIAKMYYGLLGLSETDKLFVDFEADPVFKNIDAKNSSFDFIVRENKSEGFTKNIGLIDLKATNSKGSSSSTPLAKASTGGNGEGDNTCIQKIHKIINKLNELKAEGSNDLGVLFFGLIQIKFKLDFNPDNEHEIVIDDVSHKIAPAKASVDYSEDLNDFYLSSDGKIKVKYAVGSKDKDKDNDFLHDDESKYVIPDGSLYTLGNLNSIRTEKKIRAKGLARNLIDYYKAYIIDNDKANVLSIFSDPSLATRASHYKFFACQYLNCINEIKFYDFDQKKDDFKLDEDDKDVYNAIKFDDTFRELPVELSKYILDFNGCKINLDIDNDNNKSSVKKSFTGYISEFFGLRDRSKGLQSLSNYLKSKSIEHIVIPNNTTRDMSLSTFVPTSASLIRSDPSLNGEDAAKAKINVTTEVIEAIKELYSNKNVTSTVSGLESQEGQINVSSQTELNTSYIRPGKTLTEVYSHLFELQKTINEGALAGRMIYPYEALDMTTEKLVSRIKQYGVPQKIIEKVDGQNLFFTIEKDGTLLFARNKEDMTHDDLVEKFTSHPAEKPFIEGGNAIKAGVESLLNSISQEEVIRLFHPSEGIRTFVNFEIMHPEKPNQIMYDEKYIVFHGVVDYRNGREEASRSNLDQRIQELVTLMNSGISSAGFTLASNREVDLNQLTDVQIAEYTQKIYDISETLGMEEGETLGDGIMNVIGDEIEAEGVSLSDEALTIFTDYIVRGEDSEGRSIASRDWTKFLSKEDVAKLRQLGLTSTAKVKSKISKILQPFKTLFVEIGIILLKDVQSSYMSKETAKKNIELNKDKLSTALFDLDNYLSSTPEEAWPNAIRSLIKHKEEVDRLGIENIVSTSVEGGVYNIDDSLEKVTGGFGPMNQIIGAAYRDNQGIFTTFKEKFMQQENNRRSLRDIFSLIF